jgi:ribosome assembly protein YihI (activator of Der GTPase)
LQGKTRLDSDEFVLGIENKLFLDAWLDRISFAGEKLLEVDAVVVSRFLIT